MAARAVAAHHVFIRTGFSPEKRSEEGDSGGFTCKCRTGFGGKLCQQSKLDYIENGWGGRRFI